MKNPPHEEDDEVGERVEIKKNTHQTLIMHKH